MNELLRHDFEILNDFRARRVEVVVLEERVENCG